MFAIVSRCNCGTAKAPTVNISIRQKSQNVEGKWRNIGKAEFLAVAISPFLVFFVFSVLFRSCPSSSMLPFCLVVWHHTHADYWFYAQQDTVVLKTHRRTVERNVKQASKFSWWMWWILVSKPNASFRSYKQALKEIPPLHNDWLVAVWLRGGPLLSQLR